MRIPLLACAFMALLALPATSASQSAGSGQPGRRTLLPRSDEIALARSAAPAELSANAAVWVLGDDGYALAGTSGHPAGRPVSIPGASSRHWT